MPNRERGDPPHITERPARALEPETGTPEGRELIDALKTNVDAMHAQARGHHNVVECVKENVELGKQNKLDVGGLAVDVAGLTTTVSALRTEVSGLRADVSALVAVGTREVEAIEKTGEVHKEIIEKTETAILQTFQAGATVLGDIFRSRSASLIYGFLGYAVLIKLAAWLQVPIPSFLSPPPTPMTTGPLVVLPPEPAQAPTPAPTPTPTPTDQGGTKP